MPQIGIIGGEEPDTCGCGCGEAVRGRHSVSHDLGGGQYVTYLSKHDYIWNEANPTPDAVIVPQRRIIAAPAVLSVEPAKKGKDTP